MHVSLHLIREIPCGLYLKLVVVFITILVVILVLATDLRFAPLQYIDTDSDFSWALDWLSTCFELQAKPLTPTQRQALTKALASFRDSTSIGERGLVEFISEIQDIEIRNAIDPYSTTAAGGFSGIEDNLNVNAGWWTVFEIENLMEMGEVNLLPSSIVSFQTY